MYAQEQTQTLRLDFERRAHPLFRDSSDCNGDGDSSLLPFRERRRRPPPPPLARRSRSPTPSEPQPQPQSQLYRYDEPPRSDAYSVSGAAQEDAVLHVEVAVAEGAVLCSLPREGAKRGAI